MEADVGMGRAVKFGTRLRSLLLRFLFSNRYLRLCRWITEFRRRLSGGKHVVSVFVELDDPYSYLLCSYLREFQEHYDVELRVYLTEAIKEGFRPAPQLYPEYALNDCRRLARELGVHFLDRGATPPVEHRRALLGALAASTSADNFNDDVIDALTAYWRGDSEAVARRAADAALPQRADEMLVRNQQLLARLGHYNAAMLHYGGEWYWGVDRLHHLVDRLDGVGAAREPGLAPRITSIRQVMQVNLPIKPPSASRDLPSLELFISFRSPYSYLCLTRVFAIADAFGVDLKLRPVMPMVMRGMPLPRAKRRYIAADSSREARRLGIAFGNFTDPLGAGAERCMAAFFFAESERRERDFVLHACRAIWSNAIDVATDDGLRKVTAKAGLFWPGVVAALADEGWRAAAEQNRAAMMSSGSWGVPTVRIGDWACWGQDRDWLIARHLEELCDSGEGILI